MQESTTVPPVFKATCCCGACAITVAGMPVINALCHCTDCKRRNGSAFGWSAYFHEDQIVETSGRMQLYRLSSAGGQERSFCAACGTTLHWRIGAYPGHVGIAGGCFADPPLPEPDATVMNENRCAWVVLPERWRTEVRDRISATLMSIVPQILTTKILLRHRAIFGARGPS